MSNKDFIGGFTVPDYVYTPTDPGTQMTWECEPRKGPCWRCRFHLRWPPWRKHWQCTPLPVLRYIGD